MVARQLPAAGLDLLSDFEVEQGPLDLDYEELRDRVAGAAALIPDWTVRVDAELLDAAGPSLEVVANFAVGFDHVDLDACRERGVLVTNTPDVLTNATAEIALALMMAAARRTGEMERMLRAGGWTGWEPEGLLGRELAKSTIGIVGLGRIGTRTAELLSGFGARVLYSLAHAQAGAGAAAGARSAANWRQLVAESDLVSLHVPLDRRDPQAGRRRAAGAASSPARSWSTRRAARSSIRRRWSRRCADGPAGRRRARRLRERARRCRPELIELENVVLLPHLGSATRETRDAMARLAAENVVAVLGRRRAADALCATCGTRS